MKKLERLLAAITPEAIASQSDPKSIERGRELFQKDSVDDLVADKNSIRGRVQVANSGEYEVEISLPAVGGKRVLTAQCTCDRFVDGWVKFCEHAVCLALAIEREYKNGGDLAHTENPWVANVEMDAKHRRRYQVESKHGKWHVKAFDAGMAAQAAKAGKRALSPADQLAKHYLEQEVDEAEDGAHVLEDPAFAGLLYCCRESMMSIKGIGKLKFCPRQLVLRVRAENRDNRVELHAFLEDIENERAFEVGDGTLIIGSPTWFLDHENAEIFQLDHTPPWVLRAVAETPRILMDARVGAEQMDALSEQLQSVGVPRHDLFALASDSREVDGIGVTIRCEAETVRVTLLATYGDISIAITGDDPESARFTWKDGDDALAFYRDLDAESHARKVITDHRLRWSEGDNAFIAVGDRAIEFVVAGIPMLPESWEKKIPAVPKIRRKTPTPSVSVKNKGGSVLDVQALVEVDGDDDLISFRDLLRWLHEGRRWITLSDGSVAKLDPKILQPIADAAGGFQFDKKGQVEVSTLELGTLARLLTALPSANVAADVRKLMANMTGEKASRAPRKAKTLTAKLRDYQKSGFAWLWQLHENQMSGILADDMGLGKTVQALALLTKAKEVSGPGPSLIVAPTSVLSVWKQEVKKWAPTLSELVWHGEDRSENLRLLNKTDVVVTSYALLRRDIEALGKIKWRYVLLDEAQYIKNWTTSTAKSAKALKAEHRLALSGTPLENHLVDLWAIFDFLAPGFLGRLADFQKNYVKPIENGDVNALEALRARVRPFIMRRRKEDVATELPKKTTQTFFVHMGRSQLALYNRILKAARTEIDTRIDSVGVEKSQMTILAALTRLRQVCTDPNLLQLPEGATVPPSAKLEAFKELIGECIGSGRKVLVFSQFVEMQKILVATLKEMEVEHLWLHGGTKNRGDLVNTFQQKSGPPVFIISLKAGGSGLTLTEADTVIHYDPWWNPAVEDQATDRAHRIGQDKPVMVYRLVAEGTVEQKMVELGEEKRKIAETALGRDTMVGKQLSMADVEALLDAPVLDWNQD